MKPTAILTAALLCVLSPSSFAKPLKVFILAGQSNMQGHADTSTFDYIGKDPSTAPILAAMRDAEGKPKVCENVWISSLGCGGNQYSDMLEETGKLTAGFGASDSKIGHLFTFGTQPTVSTAEIVYSGGTLTTPGAPKIVPAAGTYSMVLGRRADYVAAGLTYTVQFSAGLDVWVDNDDGTNPPVQVATDGTINAMSVPFVDFIETPSGSQKPTFSRVKVVQAP